MTSRLGVAIRSGLALAVSAAGLTALTTVSTTTAAEAAVTPVVCTVNATGTTGAVTAGSTFTANVSTGAVAPKVLKALAKVSMTVDKGESRAYEIKISHEGATAVLKNDWLGDWSETNEPLLGITFDDASSTSINKRSGPGSYAPKQNLSRFEGRTADGAWTLTTPRQVGRSENGQMHSWSAVVTYDCDYDKDGVADTRDNCPTVANTSQSNLDRDGLGDACDPDMDGDGVLNNKDNCPTRANANQADQDKDGIGDACDADRDGDGLVSGDKCPTVKANTFSGCPEVKRTLKAKYNKSKKAFVGKVVAATSKTACQSKVPVVVYRGNKKVSKTTTKKNGSFVLPRGKTGRLTVYLPPVYSPKGAAKLECTERWSRSFTVR
ncbi:thrombospondin type 3 repeat-containing protein [Nocardioides sp. Bht2]|uniref:thrombospondin type 3 repeat-containing protein n=1 Tax=Nocardioides sp. Bht2 TaxID=3392297 RepID=UPI0039B3CB11